MTDILRLEDNFTWPFSYYEPAKAVALEPEHVFVIAGPSGSGKSTFMREFVYDRLPQDVADELPRESKTWQRTSGNELSRRGLPWVVRSKSAQEGLVVHYDIMRAYTRGFDHYANDPAMQAISSAGSALTVLTILPPREVLFEQFLDRARRDDYEEWWDKKRILRPLKRKLRNAFFQAVGKSPKLLRQGHLTLLGVYGSEAGLRQWTARWEAYLESLRRGRNDVRLVYVTPTPSLDALPHFRRLPRAEA